MELRIPKLLGEVNDKDTQFTATVKQYQDLVIVGALVAIGVLIYFGFSMVGNGRTGTWRYGVCKVFLEQYTSYPSSLILLTAEEGANAARIGYLSTNAYGAQESGIMECFYSVNSQGVKLNRVTIDRKSLNLLDSGNGVRPQQSDDTPVPVIGYQDVFNLYQINDDSIVTNSVSKIRINEFNKSINVIMSSGDLDFNMPSIMAKNIEDLKYD